MMAMDHGKCGGDIAVMNRHGGGKVAQSGPLEAHPLVYCSCSNLQLTEMEMEAQRASHT